MATEGDAHGTWIHHVAIITIASYVTVAYTSTELSLFIIDSTDPFLANLALASYLSHKTVAKSCSLVARFLVDIYILEYISAMSSK